MAVFLRLLAVLGACPPDSVKAGPTCIDKYEASVWEVPPGSPVIDKIRLGTATQADLVAAGAIQRGVLSDDYGLACPDTGNDCVNLYAVSIPNVPPSRFISWFQALAAARNAGKRLPANQEWQSAAFGTPEGSPCVVSGAAPGLTGTPGCVSDVGAFDMVGNLHEWVADWVPRSPALCPGWGAFSNDQMCLAGAATTAGGPGALARGGNFFFAAADLGVFAVDARFSPSTNADCCIGFRAAR